MRKRVRVNDLRKTSIPLILIWDLAAELDHGGVKVLLAESFFFVRVIYVWRQGKIYGEIIWWTRDGARQERKPAHNSSVGGYGKKPFGLIGQDFGHKKITVYHRVFIDLAGSVPVLPLSCPSL
jgi:hypothetical protein